MVEIKVKSTQANIRLDIFLSEELNVARSQVKKMIDKDMVLVNLELPIKAGYRVKSGDIITIKEASVINPQAYKEDRNEGVVRNIEILADEKDYLVINKPAGLLMHPTMAKEKNTIASQLLKKYPEIKKVGDSPVRPGIVHRLDKEASGLLVIAKTKKMFEYLKKQFQDREIEKEYGVLVYGDIKKDHDKIDFEIDRGADGKMVSRPKIDKTKLKNVGKDQPGKVALSEFWVEDRFIRFTLLKVKIHTGRTHQIRVHMFAIGHPVFGDNLYINKKLTKKGDNKLGRLFLHAKRLCFTDLKNEKKCFKIDLPEDLKKFLKNLK